MHLDMLEKSVPRADRTFKIGWIAFTKSKPIPLGLELLMWLWFQGVPSNQADQSIVSARFIGTELALGRVVAHQIGENELGRQCSTRCFHKKCVPSSLQLGDERCPLFNAETS
jgi:hypothetical protein